MWKHGNKVNEPCPEWRPRPSGPQGDVFAPKKMEIARKVAKKMRIEHAQESHITTTQARSKDMKRLKWVCEYAYKETMRLGLARMKDKTLPNVRISPYKNDPVESVTSWLYDGAREKWSAKVSRGKTGEQIMTVEDFVRMSDQRVIITTIDSLLADNNRREAQEQNE